MAISELPSVRLYGASSQGVLKSTVASSAAPSLPTPWKCSSPLPHSALARLCWPCHLPRGQDSLLPQHRKICLHQEQRLQTRLSCKDRALCQLLCSRILGGDLETQISRIFCNPDRHLEFPRVLLFQIFTPHIDQFPHLRRDKVPRIDLLCLRTFVCWKTPLPYSTVVTVRAREMVITDFNYQSPEISKEFTPASFSIHRGGTLSDHHVLFCAFGERLIGCP